jgi:hypothetical protein
MDESIILGLHNAYKEKYEQDFEQNTKTFVAESPALNKYIKELCENTLNEGSMAASSAFEIKNRTVYIVRTN